MILDSILSFGAPLTLFYFVGIFLSNSSIFCCFAENLFLVPALSFLQKEGKLSRYAMILLSMHMLNKAIEA